MGAFLAGHAAGVDAPFSRPDLVAAVPDAPVLLSHRADAEVWYRSTEATVVPNDRWIRVRRRRMARPDLRRYCRGWVGGGWRMSRAVAGALGLLAAAATCGGAALLVRGQTSTGAALVIGSMLFMGALLAWGLRDRAVGPDPKRPFASAGTRAWLGAAAVLGAMIIGFALQRVSG